MDRVHAEYGKQMDVKHIKGDMKPKPIKNNKEYNAYLDWV